VETYRRQGRAAAASSGQISRTDDIIAQAFTTTTHHWLLVLTNRGKVYRTKVHEVPEDPRTGRGIVRGESPGMGFSGEERIASSSTSRSTRRAGTSCSPPRTGW
jgi:DNA gyrase/topoisomerase IV subunit A